MKHSLFAKKISKVRKPVGFDQFPQATTGFMQSLLKQISLEKLNSLNGRKNPSGRPAYKFSRSQLLVSILFHHIIRCTGTFAGHVFWLMGIKMSEGTLSERRQALPFEVFKELLRHALSPLEEPSPEAFYQGLKLVAMDGVEFNLANTPDINRKLDKHHNQHGKAAFAKLRCAVLLELLMHNPLAAVLGREGESEWELSKQLLEHLPNKCLLLGDQLYGCGALIVRAQEVLNQRGGHFLLRVKLGSKVARVKERLPDGSALVEVNARVPGAKNRIEARPLVREIRAVLKRKGQREVTVRFWTSLLDPEQWPAEELVRLYACRWEHELYFRELKSALNTNNLLRSQTVETAAQEVVAMIVCSAMIARERSQLAPGEELSHRISFLKVWELMEPLWLTLLLGVDILSESQKQQLVDRFYEMASTLRMAKKRKRSCPRVVRTPLSKWPRKKRQRSRKGPFAIQVIQTLPAITERH